VESLGLTTDLPVQCFCNTDWIRIPGKPFHGEHNDVMERDISPDYMGTLGAKLVEGRMLTVEDDEKSPEGNGHQPDAGAEVFSGRGRGGKDDRDIKLSPKSLRQVVDALARYPGLRIETRGSRFRAEISDQ